MYPRVRTPPISLQPRESSPHTSIDVAARFARYWQEEEEEEEEEEEGTHPLSCPLVVTAPARSFPLVPARSRSLCPCPSALVCCRPSFVSACPRSSSSAVRVRPPSFVFVAVRVHPPLFVFVRPCSCSPALVCASTHPHSSSSPFVFARPRLSSSAIVRVRPPSLVPAPALVRLRPPSFGFARPRSCSPVHLPPFLQHLPLLVLFWLMKHGASLAWWFVCIKYLVSHS